MGSRSFDLMTQKYKKGGHHPPSLSVNHLPRKHMKKLYSHNFVRIRIAIYRFPRDIGRVHSREPHRSGRGFIYHFLLPLPVLLANKKNASLKQILSLHSSAFLLRDKYTTLPSLNLPGRYRFFSRPGKCTSPHSRGQSPGPMRLSP